jgi:hypothetical protein
MLWAILLVIFAAIADSFGLLSAKFVQILFMIIALASTMAWGFWRFSAPCPRCGWNLYFKKPEFPMMAVTIPSICPNCGLDLEKPYSRNGGQPAANQPPPRINN